MEKVSDWIVAAMVGLLGLVGLIMGVGARDEEIFIFGYSLAAFGGLFIFGIFRRQAAERAAAVQGGRHG